ncbi:MAG: cellulose biosynthesis cyclic di-GMP-binding regulatory protein BcsB [Anaerolineaceae bacterium]
MNISEWISKKLSPDFYVKGGTMKIHNINLQPYIFVLKLLLIICLLIITTIPGEVSAGWGAIDEQHVVFTLNDLGYTSDDEYQGVLVSHQYDVNLPASWDFLQSGLVTISFSHSDLLNPYSSLAVDWNDTRIASVLLDSSNADHGMLQFEIPADQLVSGYNKMSLHYYMGIRDDFCEDFDNPAIWAVVHNTTSFDLRYTIKDFDPDLYRLFDRIIEPSALSQNSITLVLPTRATTAELEAAALVSAKLGQVANWRSLELKTLPLELLSELKPTGTLIIIASAEQLSALSESFLPPLTGTGTGLLMQDRNGNVIDANAGVLWVQKSPYDPHAIGVVVTAANPEGLQKAGRAFATSTAFDRLSGQLGIILNVPQPEEDVSGATPGLTYSLLDLGYHDIVAMGTNQQSINLSVPVHRVFDSLGDASLKLIFSHSDILNPDLSSISILVNNVPVSSIQLTNENTRNAEVEIKIPLRMFTLGSNLITIISNIHVDDSIVESNLYCTDEYYTDSWLTISETSSFAFPSEVGKNTASLAGYPDVYFGSPTLSNLALIVPDAPDWTTSATVLTVANRIGRSAKGDQLLLTVLPASAQESDLPEKPFQILVGLPSQNSAIMKANDLLPQPFEEDGITPVTIEGYADIVPASGDLGFIQTLFTDQGKYQMVLTATSPIGLEWVAKAMDTPTIYQSFTGNLVVLTGTEQVASFTFPTATSPALGLSSESIPANKDQANQNPDWVVILAGSIVIISLGVLLLNWLLIKRSANEKKPNK